MKYKKNVETTVLRSHGDNLYILTNIVIFLNFLSWKIDI